MWKVKNQKLHKEFTFEDFNEAFSFMAQVAKVAEQQNHHPKWTNEWNKVQIWLSTHEAGDSVTDKDWQMAEIIDEIYENMKMADIDDEKTTSSIKEVKLYADGGSRGNPGPSASGFVIMDMHGKIIVQKGVYLGPTTNNRAEYQALKLGLEEADKLGIRKVNVFMDSLLVVNQMLGKYKVKNADLWPVHASIKDLAKSFEHVTYTQVPRELNKLADAMVNKALDQQLHSDKH